NQRWRVEQAIDIGHRVEDAGVGLFWLEDVTTADDFAWLARVTAALSTPTSAIDPSRATQASRRAWFFMPPERTLGLRGGSCSSCPISVSLVFEGYVCFRQAARGAEMTGMGAKLPSAMKVGTGSFR
ncbi:MAG TPA: hypothetical protein VGH49_04750, partial [Xanthobacteraceae bacterium]